MDQIIQKKYKVMGGEFQFSAFPQVYHGPAEVLKFFDEAYEEVKRIEIKFTDFYPSYFNRINDASGVNPVVVDDETLYLINRSIEFSKKSQGLFDISFASIGHLWRDHKDKDQILDQSIIDEHLNFIDYKKIQINKKEKTVFLPYPKMKVGLGGIGKGYAVDRVYDLFIAKGLSNFYINGAGDIRVHSGADAKRKWRIGIRNPMSKDPNKSVGVIQISSGAIASSGGYIHNVLGDQFNHHIINPKTGKSKRTIIGSTILALDTITADVTATIIMNMDVTCALKYLNNESLTALFFDSKGVSYLSDKALKNFGIELDPPR